MSREYRHLQQYEKDFLELKAKIYTKREIGEKLGFTFKQIHNFITRYNEKQRRIKVVVALKKEGRPPKDYKITEVDKINELKYGFVYDSYYNKRSKSFINITNFR